MEDKVFNPFKIFIFFGYITILLISGCVHTSPDGRGSSATVSTKILRGKVLKKSGINKTFIMEITEHGQKKSKTITYDRKTKGIDHVKNRKNIVVTCRTQKQTTHAIAISPELEGFAEGVTEISAQRVQQNQKNKKSFTLIDARPLYNFQRSHIPDALSIPSCSIKSSASLPQDKKTFLIFYCDGPLCGQSIMASSFAVHAGYENVHVLKDGLTGWEQEGYPTVAEDSFVLHAKGVIIDIRPAKNDNVARIPGSVAIPLEVLAKKMKTIPHDAPVVVYGDTTRQSQKALNLLRAAGYHHPAMVKDNFKGWKKRGRATSQDTVDKHITWQHKTRRAEISPQTFTDVVSGKLKGIILDVRTPEETKSGTMTGALLIPLHNLYEQMQDLPQGQNIFVYSSNGSRAHLAATILESRGYIASYLANDVVCQYGHCEVLF